MRLYTSADAAAPSALRERDEIPARYKWNLAAIFPDWTAWEAGYAELDRRIAAFGALQGTLAQGAAQVLAALRLKDDIGQLSYKVWFYASLSYDQDQRDNSINARKQQVQILFAKSAQSSAWFEP